MTDRQLCVACGDLCIPVRFFTPPVCPDCYTAFYQVERCGLDEKFDPKTHARIGVSVYLRVHLSPPSWRKGRKRNLALLAVLYGMQTDAREAIEAARTVVNHLECNVPSRYMRQGEERQPAREWAFKTQLKPVYGCSGAWWLHKGLKMRDRD